MVTGGLEPSRSTTGTSGSPSIGIDAGGTKIAGVRVDSTGSIQARSVAPTPLGGAAEVLASMEGVVGELTADGVEALGVGVAGMVEWSAGIMRYGPNLPFRDLPLRDHLARTTGLRCLVDNDANAAAWGEFRAGAGRGSSHMLLVTVGTGIGGGIITDGRLFRGAFGYAGEIGHFIVEPGGPRCGCGNQGCWEQVASGRAIDRLGREAAQANPESALAQMAGADPTAATGEVVTAAARAGDPLATRVLATVGTRLGEGIAGLVNILDPEVVVIGGGAIEAGELLLAPARDAFLRSVEGPDYRPPVGLVAAEMGNDAGAIGAALMAIEHVDEARETSAAR